MASSVTQAANSNNRSMAIGTSITKTSIGQGVASSSVRSSSTGVG